MPLLAARRRGDDQAGRHGRSAVWPTYPWHLLADLAGEEPSGLGFLIEHTPPPRRLRRRLLRASCWPSACGSTAPRAGCAGSASAALAVRHRPGLARRLPRQAQRPGRAGPGRWSTAASPRSCSPAGQRGRADLAAAGRRTCRPRREPPALRRLVAGAGRRWSTLQIVFGARRAAHVHRRWPQRLHLLTAFAVVAAVVWLVQAASDEPAARPAAGPAASLLAGAGRRAADAGRRGVAGRFGSARAAGRCSRTRRPGRWSARRTSLVGTLSFADGGRADRPAAYRPRCRAQPAVPPRHAPADGVAAWRASHEGCRRRLPPSALPLTRAARSPITSS